jgi:intracellular multiplication protein IcmJ
MRQIPTPEQKTAPAPPPLSIANAGRLEYQPVPGVKRQMWRKDDEHAHVADAAFAPVRENVLKRDNYSCRFCAHKAPKYQEVHHFDDNHGNNDPSNLLTVCNLCHQVHHLGMCGMRNAGFIAAIPELTQVEVNQLVRAHFVVQMIGDQNSKDKLTGLYALMRARADMLKTAFNLDISSPLLFAEILSVCDDKLFAERAKLVESLRLVPTKEAFHAGQLEYYAVNQRTQFLPENWAAFARQLAG